MPTLVFDQKAGVIAKLEGDRFLAYKKISYPLIGSIYRVQLGKRLDFLSANEIDLGDQPALIFDRDRINKKENYLLVQYKARPFAKKKAMVTEKILLKGVYVILDPSTTRVSISRKITENSSRERIKEAFRQRKYGLIVRTAAKDNLQAALDEFDQLEKRMDRLKSQLNFTPYPSLLYSPEEEIRKAILASGLEVHTNSLDLSKRSGKSKIVYDRSFTYMDEPLIERELGQVKERRLSYKGAELVIEDTEALTSIDVNSKGVKGANKKRNAYRVNSLVVDKLLNQLVARQLGGIVMVDFIRMGSKDKRAFLREFKARASSYDLGITSLAFTPAGLVEILIKRAKDLWASL